MDNNNQNNQNNKPKKPVRPGELGNPNSKQPFNAYWIYAILSMGLIGMFFFGQNKIIKKIDWSDFQEYVTDNRIESIVVYSNKDVAEAKVRSESVNYVFGEDANKFVNNPFISVNIPSAEKVSDFIDKTKEEKSYDIKLKFDETSEFWGMLLTFAPFLLIIVFWIWMMRRMQGGPGGGGGGIFSVGKSKAQLFDKNAGPKVTFKDVAGLSEAKEEVQEIVEFLKHPGNYTNLGGKSRKELCL